MAKERKLKIGLCVIAKDKSDIITRMLDSTGDVFDYYFLQDTGSSDNTVEIWENWCKEHKKKFKTATSTDYKTVSPFPDKPTLGDFGKARNDSFALADGLVDYVMWVDTDDIIHGADGIPHAVEYMEKNKIPSILVRYDYAPRKNGVSPVTQWRERIIDIRVPGTWEDRVHETYKVEGQDKLPPQVDGIVLEHLRTNKQVHDTGRRNNLIMTAQLEEEGIEKFSDKMLKNLAFDHYEYKEWDKAIEYYLILLDRYENDIRLSPVYEASLHLSRAYLFKGNLSEAIKYGFQSIHSQPKSAQGYLCLAEVYSQAGNWHESIHYSDKVLELGIPNTPGAINEYEYLIVPHQIKLQAYVALNDIEKAIEVSAHLRKQMPGNPTFRDQFRNLRSDLTRRKATVAFSSIKDYLHNINRADWFDKLLKAIPLELKEDLTMRTQIKEMKHDHRRKTKKVKFSGAKTIAIYAGPHYETWDGNSDKTKGIGGSEGMCIQISRELAKLGNKVTIFNECEEEKIIDGVQYLRHEKWHPSLKCDVFISLRRPDIMTQIMKATKQYLWLHDTTYGEQSLLNFYAPDKVFALSDSHVDVLVDSHGIRDKSIFYRTRNALNPIAMDYAKNNAGERIPYKMIYASSYDRGLDNLVRMWPRIKEAIPEAEIEIFYGWNGFDKMMNQRLQQGDPYGEHQRRLKTEIMEGIAKLDGIKEMGRISQNELYKKFAEADIWFYPTEFYEISCITAMQAQALGAFPVCTPVAALKETVNADYGFKYKLEDIADGLIDVLKRRDTLDERREEMMNWAKKEYDMAELGREWDLFFNND